MACKICTHDLRDEIERCRLEYKDKPITYDELAERYKSFVSKSTLVRHFDQCLKEKEALAQMSEKARLAYKEERRKRRNQETERIRQHIKCEDNAYNDPAEQITLTITLAEREKLMEAIKAAENKNNNKSLKDRAEALLEQAEELVADVCRDKAKSVRDKTSTLQTANGLVETLRKLCSELTDPTDHPKVAALMSTINGAISGCSECREKVLLALETIKG